jgi:putative transposase
MAKEFEWAGKLNSMARQASAERAIFAIQRFFANCKAKNTRQRKDTRSSKSTLAPWSTKLQAGSFLATKDILTFTDGFAAGTFKLVGSRDLHFYAPDEIKRVRAIASC